MTRDISELNDAVTAPSPLARALADLAAAAAAGPCPALAGFVPVFPSDPPADAAPDVPTLVPRSTHGRA